MSSAENHVHLPRLSSRVATDKSSSNLSSRARTISSYEHFIELNFAMCFLVARDCCLVLPMKKIKNEEATSVADFFERGSAGICTYFVIYKVKLESML